MPDIVPISSHVHFEDNYARPNKRMQTDHQKAAPFDDRRCGALARKNSMNYYLLTTNIFPQEFADGDSLILVCDDGDETNFQMDDLEFMTTLVVKAVDDREIINEVSAWWYENTEGIFELQLITDDVLTLTKERAEFVQSLDDGQWSIKDSFVAYPKNDEISLKYAKEIIMESEFLVQ